jgi:hypothetical protein
MISLFVWTFDGVCSAIVLGLLLLIGIISFLKEVIFRK